MLNTAKVAIDKSSAPSRQTVNKKVIIAGVSFLLICITGAVCTGLMIYPSDSKQDVDEVQSGDAPSQAASITTNSQLNQAVADATTFGKIKHYAATNQLKILMLLIFVVIVLTAVVVAAVLLSTGTEADAVASPTSDLENDHDPTLSEQDGNSKQNENSGMSLDSKIGLGVGIPLGSILLILCMVLFYCRHHNLSPFNISPQSQSGKGPKPPQHVQPQDPLQQPQPVQNLNLPQQPQHLQPQVSSQQPQHVQPQNLPQQPQPVQPQASPDKPPPDHPFYELDENKSMIAWTEGGGFMFLYYRLYKDRIMRIGKIDDINEASYPKIRLTSTCLNCTSDNLFESSPIEYDFVRKIFSPVDDYLNNRLPRTMTFQVQAWNEELDDWIKDETKEPFTITFEGGNDDAFAPTNQAV